MNDEPPNKGPTVVEMEPRNELAAAFELAARSLPILMAHATNQAKLRRANYLALVKEGFTEQQALDLCRYP